MKIFHVCFHQEHYHSFLSLTSDLSQDRFKFFKKKNCEGSVINDIPLSQRDHRTMKKNRKMVF